MQSRQEYDADWPSLPSASAPTSIPEGVPPGGSRKTPRGPEPEPEPEPDTLLTEVARLRAERDALIAAAAHAATASAATVGPSAYVLGQRLPGDLEEGLCVEFKDTERHRFSANINKYVLKTVAGFLNSRQGGVLYFGVDDRSGRVTGVPFPAGDEGRSAWDKWALAAGTALRRCRECGGGKNEDFRVFASRSIAPSQYEMVRSPVTCEGSDPETYVVRAHDGKTAGPPPVGQELYVVEIRVQKAADWDRALVGDCTTWLIKQRHRSAAGESCEYVRWVRLDKQTVVESTLSLSAACALCSVPEPKATRRSAGSGREVLAIGEHVEARYTEDSTRWKLAVVVGKQLETDSFVLHFDGYADETTGVPRSRIRPVAAAARAASGEAKSRVVGAADRASEAGSLALKAARVCAQCCEAKARSEYSLNQWTKKDAGFSRCVVCCSKEQDRRVAHHGFERGVAGGSAGAGAASEQKRACATCSETKQKSEYSNNQWRKASGARCTECVGTASVAERQCAACGSSKGRSAFSTSQWRKGSGFSRCDACVGGVLRPTKRATSGHQER